ncbi:MAG: SLOG family protein, partial [Clostridia bacterium]|nr:SLOG family protein [Clostridia bacterium]
LEKTIKERIGDNTNDSECISGMALGVDTIFALAAINLQSIKGHNTRLVCALPCLGQDLHWQQQDAIRYGQILKLSDEVVYVSNQLYINGCMQARNQYMINRCNVLIAVYNGDRRGGTADTVKRAQKAGKEIIFIHPKEIAPVVV